MPPKSDRVKITFYITPEQGAALKAALTAADIEQSAFIRQTLASVIPDWPDDMPRRGVYERKSNPK